MKFLLILSAVLFACSAVPTSRIVGGFEAKNGTAPYQASLKDHNFNHLCSASVINNRWLLTAAHCISHRLRYVYLGSNHIYEGGRHYGVEETIVHDHFAGAATFLSNDIGLLKVDKDIVFNDAVQPIKLRREFVKGGEQLKATGWGWIKKDQRYLPEKLQELHVEALENDDCKKRTAGQNIKLITQLCTFLSEEQGICRGDSGGPLVLNGEQVGLASFVVAGCAMGYPDFFTRVSLFVDWIEDNTKN